MQPKIKVKTRLNKAHIRKKIKRGTREALPGAGVIVQRSARKQFSHRNVKTKPNWSQVGTKDGRPVLAMEFRPPIPGKVTSWKNPRGRGATRTGFLRTLIRFEVDTRKDSVVIGPTNEATWLNKLQEFGGSARRVLKLVGRYPGKSKLMQKFPPPGNMLSGGSGKRRDQRGRFLTASQRGGSAYVGLWIDPAHTRRKGKVLATAGGKVKPGRYMKKGLDAKRDKLAAQWKGKIYGP
jgi:hypothetical protein